MKKIVYVGNKETKGDNVAGTGLVWRRGEVHEIADDIKCAKLLDHSTIWRDATDKDPAQISGMLLPELRAVATPPSVHLMANEATGLSWKPIVIEISADEYSKLAAGTYDTYFMSKTDAALFSAWKLQQTAVEAVDSAPRQTGPKPQARDTRQGLESAGKKVA